MIRLHSQTIVSHFFASAENIEIHCNVCRLSPLMEMFLFLQLIQFSKFGPQTSIISIKWQHVRNAHS